MIHTIKLLDKVKIIVGDYSPGKGSFRSATFEIDSIPVQVNAQYYYSSKIPDGIYKLAFSNPLVKKHRDYKQIRRQVLCIFAEQAREDYRINPGAIR